MSKKHNIMYCILLIFSLALFTSSCIQGDFMLIACSLALLGSLVIGHFIAAEYALWLGYYKKIQSYHDEEIETYEELVKNLEDQRKLLIDWRRDSELQRARLMANNIIFARVARELIKNATSTDVEYSNRWLDKGAEIKQMIDNTYKNNPNANLEELFDSLIKLRQQIDSGEVDINRD